MPTQRQFSRRSSAPASRRAPNRPAANEVGPCGAEGASRPPELSGAPGRVIPLTGSRPPQTAAAGPKRSKLRRRNAVRRVLLVDDNQDHVRSLAALLEAMGHEVRTEYDGGAALDAVAEFRPQAVILDIGLPVMDGYEVARRLRAAYRDRGPLLIALTGYGQPRDGLQAKAAGFDSFMVKPPDLRALGAILNDGMCSASGG